MWRTLLCRGREPGWGVVGERLTLGSEDGGAWGTQVGGWLCSGWLGP